MKKRKNGYAYTSTNKQIIKWWFRLCSWICFVIYWTTPIAGVDFGDDKSCCFVVCSRALRRRLAILDDRRVSSWSDRVTKLVTDEIAWSDDDDDDDDVVSFDSLIERLRFFVADDDDDDDGLIDRLLFVSFESGVLRCCSWLERSLSLLSEDVVETNDAAAAIWAICCKIAMLGYVAPSWFVDGQNGVAGGNIGKHAAVAFKNVDVNDEYDERISAGENELKRVRRLAGGVNNGCACVLASKGWVDIVADVDDELIAQDGFIFSRLRHLARRFWNQTCTRASVRSIRIANSSLKTIRKKKEKRFLPSFRNKQSKTTSKIFNSF